MMRVSELYLHPVKSCGGHAVERVALDPQGPRGDRRWMVTDPTGQFLTQRELARMALIQVGVTDSGITLRAPGFDTLTVMTPPQEQASERLVTVWRDQCRALLADAAANQWFSDFLQRPAQLVHLPDSSRRPVDPRYATASDQVSFADGFPLLLIGAASLDELNSRLDQPVSMRRFRPNLVVSGGAAFAEDGWRRLRIGTITFRVAKPCARCAIPGIDPDSGQTTTEPLRTLARFRRRDGVIYFGQNLLHDGPGTLTVGDPVELLE
ncbi:MAG TPA: MOSC domain-containing protein [Pseudomonadales bacterium]|nr:MOSC domain-containing protein [Pseudomonadales bacterium]HNJ74217.1 MOSC domain-containing protein [Pseudomonadales bacterium]